MKNKEVNKFYKNYIIISLIFIVTMIISYGFIFNIYKEKTVENNAIIVNKLIEKHPELEEDIIESIVNSNNIDDSYKVIDKYGLNDEDLIMYTNDNFKFKSKSLMMYLSIIILFIIASFIIFNTFIKSMYRQIRGIHRYTNKILNDNYDLNIRSYDEGDISNLKNNLYKMTIKLKEQAIIEKKDKQFLEDTLSDISHQLKTPLTSMYVINEVLEDDKLNDKERKNFLKKNYNQLQRIEWLITSLLKISRLDSGSEYLNFKKENLYSVIEEAIKPIKEQAEITNISINNNCNKDISIDIDRYWTREALLNIIKNAFEHTKSYVNITCLNNPLYTLIEIEDNGCGINKDDLPHIFERFYKGKENPDSIGIGLNMAKKIIDKENGDITVRTKENEGTTFIIKIYKKTI